MKKLLLALALALGTLPAIAASITTSANSRAACWKMNAARSCSGFFVSGVARMDCRHKRAEPCRVLRRLTGPLWLLRA